jgi:hypothetical protein
MPPITEAPARTIVNVTYNGMTRPVDYNLHEQGRALFQRACETFGIPGHERDSLALYLPDNSTEVPPDLPVEQGGVQPNATLILRGRQTSGA